MAADIFLFVPVPGEILLTDSSWPVVPVDILALRQAGRQMGINCAFGSAKVTIAGLPRPATMLRAEAINMIIETDFELSKNMLLDMIFVDPRGVYHKANQQFLTVGDVPISTQQGIFAAGHVSYLSIPFEFELTGLWHVIVTDGIYTSVAGYFRVQ